MSLGKNCRLIKITTGEMIITEVELNDEGNYNLKYPLVLAPMQQPGGATSIGFGKFMPFSRYDKDITLNTNCMIVDSEPAKDLIHGYEKAIEEIRMKESGLVSPTSKQMQNVLKNGTAQDFSKLNT